MCTLFVSLYTDTQMCFQVESTNYLNPKQTIQSVWQQARDRGNQKLYTDNLLATDCWKEKKRKCWQSIVNAGVCIGYPFLMHCGIEKGENDHSVCPLFYPTMHQKRIINAKLVFAINFIHNCIFQMRDIY